MKKFLAILLCGIMVIGAVPLQVSAKSMDTELEDAIRTVKTKIDVPISYSKFEYYFGTPDSYEDTYLELVWSNPQDESSIRVNCDKNNHIIYYSKQDYSEKTSSVPKYLKNELKVVADEFIKKIAPDIDTKLKYLNENSSNTYSGRYQYDYQRQENGISFPDNYVTITVDSKTGKVSTANISWLYDVTVPSSKTEITLEDATKQIKNNLSMKLSYQTNYLNIYNINNEKTNNIEKAFLVYQPDKQYVAIDAKTGKIYTTKSETKYTDAEAVNAGENTSAKDEATAQLTEQEINEIETLKNLITKEVAIKKVTNNKYLLIDKNLKKINATLNKSSDNTGKEVYTWNIEMSDPREIDKKNPDTYRAYAYAQVNAKTGKVIRFNTSIKDNYNETTGKWDKVSIKYKKDTCQEMLEKFLKAEISSQFKNAKLSLQTNDYVAYYTKGNEPVYGGYYFRYNRVNDGVEYSSNSIQSAVDGVTGKIYSFSSYWNDNVVFESTTGIISKKQALDYYLNIKDGFHLVYEINQVKQFDAKATTNKSDYEIRLVYRTDINPTYVSPITGAQLNYDGSVYTKTKPYTYVDIDNSEQYRAVYLLSDMNVGFEGDHFYPNKEVLVGELYTLLNGIGVGSVSEKKRTNSNGLITREEIAYYFIECLSLDKLSGLQGIYATGYSDQSSIDSKYVGAVALAKGLGIITGDSNNNFNPKKNVTRLEAVNMILNFIKVQNEGVY